MKDFVFSFIRGFVISFGIVLSAYLLAGLIKLAIQ